MNDQKEAASYDKLGGFNRTINQNSSDFYWDDLNKYPLDVWLYNYTLHGHPMQETVAPETRRDQLDEWFKPGQWHCNQN